MEVMNETLKTLLDKKAESNNTIDLNAYAMGLEDGFNTDPWIKVSERLPEQIGSYLVFYRDEKGLKCTAWGFYNTNSEWCVENKKLSTITHWMPLPNAPKD